jgi:hypothetical protein
MEVAERGNQREPRQSARAFEVRILSTAAAISARRSRGNFFCGEKRSANLGLEVTGRAVRVVRPNPSIERIRNGKPRRAFISFWAMRVLPLRAAHVKR